MQRNVEKYFELPFGAEINMIISCGIREEVGVRGDRTRIPFEEIYKNIEIDLLNNSSPIQR